MNEYAHARASQNIYSAHTHKKHTNKCHPHEIAGVQTKPNHDPLRKISNFLFIFVGFLPFSAEKPTSFVSSLCSHFSDIYTNIICISIEFFLRQGTLHHIIHLFCWHIFREILFCCHIRQMLMEMIACLSNCFNNNLFRVKSILRYIFSQMSNLVTKIEKRWKRNGRKTTCESIWTFVLLITH